MTERAIRHPTAFMEKAVDGLCGDVRNYSGSRNRALRDAGWKLGTLAHLANGSFDAYAERLRREALSTGLPSVEVLKTLQRAIRDGRKEPQGYYIDTSGADGAAPRPRLRRSWSNDPPDESGDREPPLDEVEGPDPAAAQAIWNAAVDVVGTPAEQYLARRGISAKNNCVSIRYAKSRDYHYCIFASRDAGGGVVGVQRVSIDEAGEAWTFEGGGKRKLSTGPVGSGLFVAMEGDGPPIVTEGAEDALAVAMALREAKAPPRRIVATFGSVRRALCEGAILFADDDHTLADSRKLTADAGALICTAGHGCKDAAALLAAKGAAAVLDAVARADSPVPAVHVMSSADFAGGFVAPEFLVEGVVQRGYCYSLTAPTGTGKTSVAILLAFCVALGLKFGRAQCERGRVVFFAGENPDDVRGRVLAMADALNVDLSAVDIHWTDVRFDITNAAEIVGDQIEAIGGVDLAIVDTAMAFFGGDDDNSNAQMAAYAGALRRLTQLPGHPAILIPCHPVKNATKENCLPRGGGAFVAEVDGNLRLWSDNDGETAELHWCGKIRGPGFDPLFFETERRACVAVHDRQGRLIPMPVAKALADVDMQAIEAREQNEDGALLEAMLASPNSTQREWARACGWVIPSTGEGQTGKVVRVLKRLTADKLVRRYRRRWVLTDAGKKEAERAFR